MPSGVFSLKQVNQALVAGAWSNQKPVNVDYLVVAGGGGAGASDPGGGGGGGVTQGNISVVPNSSYTVTIGAGGAGRSGGTIPGSGNNSVFGNIAAIGGGYGGTGGTPGGNGGSGGGGGSGNAVATVFGQGTFGQGNRGGTASFNAGSGTAGGGGAGTAGLDYVGSVGGAGGVGVFSTISGSRNGYGGGGGGSGTAGGLGGAGGGGAGVTGTNGGSGTANTGGGGGGAPNYTGGSGGSGVVILSYPDIYAAPAATTGSPTVSTSGSGSISFNGTNQALIYPSNTNYAFGTGNFTVEMFLYRSNTSGILLDARSASLSETWAMYNPNGKLAWYTGPLDISTPSDIPLNSWAHVAVCRFGTTTRLFISGNLETSFTDNTNYTTTSTLKIGRNAGGGGYFGGNMSNIRITKGIALYTSNFTVPIIPFSPNANTGLLLSAVSGSAYVDFSGNSTISTTENLPLWSSSSPFATGLGYKNRVYTWTSSGSITF